MLWGEYFSPAILISFLWFSAQLGPGACICVRWWGGLSAHHRSVLLMGLKKSVLLFSSFRQILCHDLGVKTEERWREMWEKDEGHGVAVERS